MSNRFFIPHKVLCYVLPLLCASVLVLPTASASVNDLPEIRAEYPVTAANVIKGRVELTKKDYEVGAGDVLKYQVYLLPEYDDAKVLVRPDGYATFKGVGDVFVEGLTLPEVVEAVDAKLRRYVKKPNIFLSVAKLRPATVYLSGAVLHPGMYQLATDNNGSSSISQTRSGLARLDFRLTNVLANSGGVAMNADLAHIKITHPKSGKTETVNLWKVLKDGDTNQDLWLQSGDRIQIDSLKSIAMDDDDFSLLLRSSIGPQSFPVRVLGRVEKPGRVSVVSDSPFLNTVISETGGFSDDANRKIIAIRRFTTNKDFTTLYVDPSKTDVVLRPNDVVFISEHKAYKAGRFMGVAKQVLDPFVSTVSSLFFVTRF